MPRPFNCCIPQYVESEFFHALKVGQGPRISDVLATLSLSTSDVLQKCLHFHKMNRCYHLLVPVVIGGSRRRCCWCSPSLHPPVGPNSFLFAHISTEKRSRRMLTPLHQWVCAPSPQQEILDPPLIVVIQHFPSDVLFVMMNTMPLYLGSITCVLLMIFFYFFFVEFVVTGLKSNRTNKTNNQNLFECTLMTDKIRSNRI